jgi:methionyl-tRNA formyltransferase
VSLRLIFMGTGDFGVPSLRALKRAGHSIALVVCQPDRPKGRGQQLQAPPLKQAALDLGLEVFQPEKLRAPEAVERLLSAKVDLGCVVSYGQILSQAALDAPRLGCVNVHGSLLPRWRGAAPIEWAVAEGDAETGVCVQRMVLKLDAGDVLVAERLPLGPTDEASGLHERLAEMGAAALLKTVGLLEAGPLQGQPQDESLATYAPLLKKADGFLDPAWSCAKLLNRFRAFKSRPGVHVQLQGGELLKIHAMGAGASSGSAQAGRLLTIDEDKGFEMAAADGTVWLGMLQPPSAKAMPAAAYARGRHLKTGTQFVMPVQTPGA